MAGISAQYVKCCCWKCGNHIEFDVNGLSRENSVVLCPHCGFETKLFVPTPREIVFSSVPQIYFPEVPVSLTEWPTSQEKPTVAKSSEPYVKLSQLTDKRIRRRSVLGETPVHRAAKLGAICAIPNHLLKAEMFMIKNKSGDTPLHIAARNGTMGAISKHFISTEALAQKNDSGDTPLHVAAKFGMIRNIPGCFLNAGLFAGRNDDGEAPLHIAARCGYMYQVPTVFLTMENLMIWDNCGETPLHVAARCGEMCRIPKKLLTPDLLILPTRNSRANTTFHLLASLNRLDVVPECAIAPEMWNLRNGDGLSPRDVLLSARQRFEQANRGHPWQGVPATEAQKAKLAYFSCIWDEGITKKQASDALDECARQFPIENEEYYNRPAVEKQLTYLRPRLQADGEEPDDYADEGKKLTYRQAKELIREFELEERREREEKELVYWSRKTDKLLK